jgi:hypothetical protein
MTKQQLREAIRKIIKAELNEELKPNPNAGKWRILNDKTKTPMTKEFYNSKEEAMDAAKALGRTNAPGIKIVQLKDTLDEALTADEQKDLDHIEDIIRHKAKTDSASISKKMADRYKELKLKVKKKIAENAPATKPSEKPSEEEKEVIPGKPGEKEKPRRTLDPKPVTTPAKAITATMKEAEMLKKVIQRFKAKKNA